MTTLGIALPLTVTCSLYFGPVDNPASLALPSESSFLNASPKPPKMFKDVVVDNNGGDDDDNWTNATTIQWLSDTNTMSAMRKDERIVLEEPHHYFVDTFLYY